MLTLFQDLKFAVRGLQKHRGFTVVALLTIALGIGINTALFTVFDAFVLKPLPLKDPANWSLSKATISTPSAVDCSRISTIWIISNRIQSSQT